MLSELPKEKTVLVITHKYSTINWVDYIMVLDDGQVKEIGTHEELIDNGGIYKDLYNQQFVNNKTLNIEEDLLSV